MAETNCTRCAVIEDLLETATSERDKARDEAAKADREALSLKEQMMSFRLEEARKGMELVYYYKRIAKELGATPEQLLER